MYKDLFDLDEVLVDSSDSTFEDDLRKAEMYLVRELPDKAKAIYLDILSKNRNYIPARIGLIRIYSNEYQILDNEDIDEQVHLIEDSGTKATDEDYLAFLAKRHEANYFNYGDEDFRLRVKILTIDEVKRLIKTLPEEDLVNFKIPKGITNIDDGALCPLDAVIETLTYQGPCTYGKVYDHGGFKKCFNNSIPYNLKTIYLKNVSSLDHQEFEGVRRVAHYIFLDKSIDLIGEFAWSSSAVQEITLPKSLVKIYRGTFLGCEDLTKVTLESGIGISELPESFVNRCPNLEEINLPHEIKHLGPLSLAYDSKSRNMFNDKLRVNYDGTMDELKDLLAHSAKDAYNPKTVNFYARGVLLK